MNVQREIASLFMQTKLKLALPGVGLSLPSLLLVLCGCFSVNHDTKPPQPTPDEVKQLIEAKVKSYNDVIAILKTIRDQETIKKGWSRLLLHHQKEQDLRKRFATMPRPSPESLASMKEYVDQLSKARKAQKEEIRRIQDEVPGGQAFIEQLKTLETADLVLSLQRGSP